MTWTEHFSSVCPFNHSNYSPLMKNHSNQSGTALYFTTNQPVNIIHCKLPPSGGFQSSHWTQSQIRHFHRSEFSWEWQLSLQETLLVCTLVLFIVIVLIENVSATAAFICVFTPVKLWKCIVFYVYGVTVLDWLLPQSITMWPLIVPSNFWL